MKCTTVLIIAACSHFGCLIVAAYGETISVLGDVQDYVIYQPRDCCTPYVKSGGRQHYVGNEYYPGTTVNDVNIVHVFQLPVLNSGRLISADYSFNYLPPPWGSRLASVDIWGIDIRSSTTPIVEFYVGNSDDGFAGNVKLQEDILISTTPYGVIHTDATGDLNLLDYLRTFYNANTAYTGGAYAFLRLNHDGPTRYNGDGWMVAMTESPSAGPILTLDVAPVPEPTTLLLAALAIVPFACRRRKQANCSHRSDEGPRLALTLVSLLTVLPAAPARAQQLFKLTASDAASEDFFGDAVALNGNNALVGAMWHDDTHSNSGAAYVFDATTGQQLRKLIPSNAAAVDWFGSAVALSGSTALVGATGDNNFAGSTFVFNVATGQQLFKLSASDAAPGDLFGTSIAVSGNRVLIGARGDKLSGNGSTGGATGSAYLFDLATGQQLRKFTSPSVGNADEFGISVAMTGGIAIIGARNDSTAGASSGAAYVFDVVTGQQLFRLTATDAVQFENFGRSVALNGNLALIGAGGNGSSTGPQSFGSAYLFDVTTGQQLFKLAALDRAEGDLFGFDVALGSSLALVGAKGDDDAGNGTGSVYVFNASTGQQLYKLNAMDAAAGDGFGGGSLFGGHELALSGDIALIAASGDDDAGNSSGAVYLFHVTPVPEPSTLLLAALALVPFGWRRNRPRISIRVRCPGAILRFESLAITSVVFLLAAPAHSQQLFKLTASDAASGDFFGNSVALSGNTSVVGAFFDDDAGESSGSAYVFNATTGQQVHKLTANDAAEGDMFGRSVAVSGSTALVGANGDDGLTGSAYVFNTTTGQQLRKLTASDRASTDNFGSSVALSGSLGLVGAYWDNPTGDGSFTTGRGSAYLFDVTTGQQLRKLTAADATAGDQFGVSVALNGNIALIGAWYDDAVASHAGSAYLFDVTTGQQLFKLTAADAAVGDTFGHSVALDGNLALIGARGDDSSRGAAYLFDVTTGQQLYKFIGSDAQAGDWFGHSVALSGNIALIGASDDNGTGIDGGGAAYVFDVVTGQQLYKYSAAVGGDDVFGADVALDGVIALIGESANDDAAQNAGAAYLYRVNAVPEPSTLLLATLALVPFASRRRRGVRIRACPPAANVRFALLTIAFLALQPAAPARAQQLFKLTASDAALGDSFGWSVALSGNKALIGAWDDDNSTGSAYVYDVTTGQQIRKLTPRDRETGDRFGVSIALNENTALVGSYQDDDAGNGSGSAYLFDVTTGQQVRKLAASDGAAGHAFGISLALDGNLALVGATRYQHQQGGAAYLFDATTGQELRKLTASDAADDDFFGHAVALSGNLALVGSYLDDDAGNASGSAYLFNVTTGQQLFKLTASDGQALDRFGISVALAGNMALVGAYPPNAVSNKGPGAAYLFDATTGQQLFKLTSSDAAELDWFGISVALSGNSALVGASQDDDHGANSGAAYLFDITTGHQLSKLTASDGAAGHSFGNSVALENKVALIGAEGATTYNNYAGAAYLFRVNPVPEPSTLLLIALAVAPFSWRRVVPKRPHAHTTNVQSALLALALAALSVRAVSADQAAFISGAVLPAGSRVMRVADGGAVIVTRPAQGGGSEVFRWSRTAPEVSLGVIPFSSLAHVSEDGTAAFGYITGDPSHYHWTLTGGVTTVDPVLSIVAGSSPPYSGDAQSVVGYTISPRRPARWTESSGFQILSTLDSLYIGIGASADGSVVLASPGGGIDSYLWSESGAYKVPLPVGGQGYTESVTKISGDGKTVIGGTRGVFRWSAAAGQQFLPLTPDGKFLRGDAQVSFDGSTLAGFAYTEIGTGTTRAVIWNEAHGTRYLDELLATEYGLGSQVAGWTLPRTQHLSPDGRTIYGAGRDPAGNSVGWIAILGEPVPEPSTLVLAALALISAFPRLPRRTARNPAVLPTHRGQISTPRVEISHGV